MTTSPQVNQNGAELLKTTYRSNKPRHNKWINSRPAFNIKPDQAIPFRSATDLRFVIPKKTVKPEKKLKVNTYESSNMSKYL